MQAEKLHEYTIHVAKEQFPQESCNVDFDSDQFSEEGGDYAKIDVGNMFLPLLVLGVFAGLASVLQVWHSCQRRRGRKTMFGRHSTLRLNIPGAETFRKSL